MESTTVVKLLSLEPYRYLFPKAQAIDKTIKMGADVSDTVDFIPQVVRQCAWQVEKFVNKELKGLSRYKACEKLWHFVKHHIKYEKDARGLEQVRSPRRLINDKKGDCDCFTTFIDTCLTQLGIKGIINRITKYKKDHFQHIYPVVPLGNGKYIIMDCVVDRFNYEEPYSEKKDYNMDLQFLDGIEETKPESDLGDLGRFLRKRVAAQNFLTRQSDMGELGKLFKKKSGGGGGGGGGAPRKKGLFKKPLFKKPLVKKPIFKKRTPEKKQAAKEKRKTFVKKALKVVNKVNKINPVTLLLRAGILASMKLNILKVAEKLKWGYATKEHAASKGMDMSKYDKLKAVLAKTEKIFYASGGKPENLRNAIITGNGNRNREVAGIEGFNENSSLPEMLGAIYDDEFINGMEGFEGTDGLGEPATAAAITAASATMGALAALLKGVGVLFPKKSKEKTGEESAEAAPEEGGGENSEPSVETSSDESSPGENETPENSDPPSEESNEENLPAPVNDENEIAPTDEGGGEENSEESEPTEDEGASGLSGIGTGIKAFYQKHKSWIVPVGIAAVTLTTIAIIASVSSKTEEKEVITNPSQVVNGVQNKRRRKRKGGDRRGQTGKQSVIALM